VPRVEGWARKIRKTVDNIIIVLVKILFAQAVHDLPSVVGSAVVKIISARWNHIHTNARSCPAGGIA